jgi:WbqC-like protein family
MQMKRVAIGQSNYIPWRGYFALIAAVDEFVLLDNVQYTRRDWRNRNRIKTELGTKWLTIPVSSKGRFTARIDEMRVNDRRWTAAHWATLRHHYRRAACFDFFSEHLEALYHSTNEDRLTEINERFLRTICDWLEITTTISRAMDDESRGPTDRLVRVCRTVEASAYISGPSARAYIDAEQFGRAGITLRYADYSILPDYPQLFPPFRPDVSIVDLLLNTGPDAPRFVPPVDLLADS